MAQSPTTAVQWADSARKAIDEAYLNGEPNQLVQARALVERALTRFPADPWLLHYRGFALYREATLRQGKEKRSDVVDLLESAQTSLEQSAARLDLAETDALLSSVIGQQIGSNPLKGMTLGPRSGEAMERALSKGPQNPRVWVLKGIGEFYTPGMFGGGADKAETSLRKAIRLFEKDEPVSPAPAWGNDEAWLWLGQVLEERKKWDEARVAYAKALELQPRNQWVRMELLPNLDKRKAKK
jgi:tetratricopeptide (TPR) repeat protein